MRYFVLLLGVGVFALDFLSKWWIKNTVWLHYYTVIDGFVTIHFVKNEGIAFGLFHSLDSEWKPIILSSIAVVAVCVVLIYIFQTPLDDRLTLVALGLLLGGILGNFTDRIVNSYVFDFLKLHIHDIFAWPTFNVADMAITTGVALILFRTFTDGKHKNAAALLLMSPWLGLSTPAPETEQIVARLQETYDSLGSFTADFEQTLTDRGITIQESGVVKMKRPGRMYWEYRHPTEKYFVADGRKTYFYVPKDNQVIVSELDLETTDSPLLFLLGYGEIKRDFEVAVDEGLQGIEGEEAPYVLHLSPRSPSPEFTEIILEITRSTFLIQKLTIVEPIGQRNEYILKELQRNVEIPDKQFTLKLPSQVEVIER